MVVSGGNYATELDYLELGERVAVSLDAEAVWGAAVTYWWYTCDYSELENE